MKILLELAIIFLISVLGEAISILIPIAIPSSIIALVLLLLLLGFKIIKPDMLECSGNWLLSNMAIFFIPACISILEHTQLLFSSWWQIILISTISFFLTFIASGYTVMAIQKLLQRRKKDV